VQIAVNTRLLLPNKLEGIGRFAHELLQRLVCNNPQHTFYFIFDRAYDPKYIYAENVVPVVLAPQARHPFLYWIWFELSINRWLKKNKMDVFFSPDGYLSLKNNTKQIGVFHDLNFEHYPEDLGKIAAWHYRRYFPKYAKKANKLITVSNFSKQEIVKLYAIEPTKISVLYNGVSNDFTKPLAVYTFKETYTHGADYFLVVGSIHPRKNTNRILDAFKKYKTQHNTSLKLVFVGDAYRWNTEMKVSLDKHPYKTDIVFTGHLDIDNLHQAYTTATALCYVSYYEGFGIPMVEAMACGCPVLAANNTVMPEIAEEAALYVDPFNVDAIADGLLKISQVTLRTELANKGKIQYQKYSWDESAKQLAEILEL